MKTSTPKRMDTLSSRWLIRQCSRCSGDAAFFCAICHCGLCLPCKENHGKDLSTLDHDVMIYHEKDRCISEQENCIKHVYSVCRWYCESCEVPFCDFCNEHRKHSSIDIQRKVQQKGEIIRIIRSESLFVSRILLKNNKSDFKTYQTKILKCKSDMQANALKLKERIDTAFCEFDFKHSCLNQETKLHKRIGKIYRFEQKFQQSSNKGIQFIRFIKKKRFPKIQSYQGLKRHAHLSLTDPLSFHEIEEPFCDLTITEKGKRSRGYESQLKLMQSPKLQTFLTLKNVDICCHIVIKKSDRVWVNEKDTLILTDSNGDTLTCLKTLNEFSGLHSINKDNELIYIDDNHNIITLANNMENKKTNTSIKSTEWKPNCLFYSRSTGDLLVGMYAESEGEGKIIRYSQSREQTQTIKHDSEGYNLYSKPCYIVENNNFDVVVSDSIWRTVDNSSEESSAIVVTERRGRHRFTYRGHPPGSRIVSRGLCIDALSHIIFCDNKTSTVQMLSRDGMFLSHLLIRPPEILKPHGLGYDFRTHLLWVGSNRNIISVYRYIARRAILTGKSYVFLLMKYMRIIISLFYFF